MADNTLDSKGRPLVSPRPKAPGYQADESKDYRDKYASGLDVEFRSDMQPLLQNDPIARAGFDPERIKYTMAESNGMAQYDPNIDEISYGSWAGASEDVIAHEARHRGFQQLKDMYNEDPEWFGETYGKEAVLLLTRASGELQTELKDNPDVSWKTGGTDSEGNPSTYSMEDTITEVGESGKLMRNYIETGVFSAEDSRNADLYNKGFEGLDRAASDMLEKRGEPPKTAKRETGSQEASRKTIDRGAPPEEGGFFSNLKAKMGFAEGGLAMDKQMKKMYDEGGLATDGMDIDPVSGNDIPVGSNAEDVRDDVDAKLSSGEYVVPADVVKYLGVAQLEKLVNKAKDGLEDMEENGRIGGDLDNYADGGIVEGTDYNAILDRVKAAAVKDPSLTNMLKAKGIFIQEPQPQGAAQQAAMTEGTVPAQAAPPAIQGEATPAAFAEGGMVYGEGLYKPSNYSSSYNPYEHGLGFSIETNATGQAPGKPYKAPTEAEVPVCPEGYIWEPELKVCMPIEVEEPSQPKRSKSRTTMPETPKGNPNAWMEKYDYGNPDALFEQSLATLGDGSVEDKDDEESSWLGSLGDSVKGLLSGGLVSKFMNTTKSAQVAANVITLRSMGRDDLADELEAQNDAFVKNNGLTLVPEGMRDGDRLAAAVKAEKGNLWSTDATQPASSSTGGGGSGSGGSSTAPTEQAPLVSPRPPSRPSIAQRASADRIAAEDKAMESTSIVRDTSDIGGGSGSLVTGGPSTPNTPSQNTAIEEKKAEEMGSVKQDDGSYDISSWYNKGGLVKPRTKVKAKAKTTAPKGKRGLGKK